MDAITAKLECLKLAARKELPDPDQTVKDAETYWRWVIDDPGSRPGQSEGTPDTS